MIARMRSLASRIQGWVSRKRVDQDFEQELSAHLEMLMRENIARGMAPDEAKRAARIRLGGVTQLKETNRRLRGLPMLETFFQDLRYAFRRLCKNPGFTIVAVLTLALGIGANTAIFSVVQGVFLRSLPVDHPEQLVAVDWDATNWPRGIVQSGYGGSFSYFVFQELRTKSSSVSNVFGFAPLGYTAANTNVVVDGRAALVDGAMVTGGFFSGLGVNPILGRTINDEDDGASSPRVAVLSYNYWNSRFAADPRVVGRNISVNNLPCTIVGVAPAGFRGVVPGNNFDIYVSLSDGRGLTPFGSRAKKDLFRDELWFWMQIMARMKPGVTLSAARTDLNAVFQTYLTSTVLKGYQMKELPYITIAPGGKGLDRLRQAIADPITLLQWMVGLILLMSCANVAALLMARATSRSAEMGIRLAIGGSRTRLVSQLLVENLTLALAGSALGVAFAQWGARTLMLLLSPRGAPISVDVHVDLRVLLFAIALAFLTTILFGLGPSISATRVDVISSLKESSRNSVAGRPRTRMRSVLVCAQVAVSLVLLAGAGLFLRTLQKLENENLGFNRQQVLLFGINPSQNGYEGNRLATFYSDLQARIEAIPGVRSASLSQLSLISGWINNGGIAIEGSQATKEKQPSVYNNAVGTHFFATMGIPVILGRDFEQRDLQSTVRVATVNQAFVSKFWPNQNPLGHRFNFGPEYRPAESYEIVGVVQDAKFANVKEKIHATAYTPYSQERPIPSSMHFAVKTYGESSDLIPGIREIVREIDPALPLYDVKTETQQIEESLSTQHMFAQLSTFFGGLALLLASIGLYGLLAYSVGQRIHEFGIRMALGAQRGNILSMVFKSGTMLVTVGVVIGAAGALAATRLLKTYLYGVQPSDPWTLAGAALVLIVVALIACWIPARRATRVDPMIALRYE
jgi:predicted permease